MKKTMLLGISAAFFFSFTFVLNRSLSLSGDYWLWTAVLRYVYTLPLAFLLVLKDKKVKETLEIIKQDPIYWLIWSTVGFGFFYLPMSFASDYGESWAVSATWQITVVAGVLLTPLFGKKIPIKNLLISCVIVVGVFVMQIDNMSESGATKILLTVAPLIVSAFAFPLGNRKTMQKSPENMGTMQRIFAMTLCSMPFWIISGIFAFANAGPPSGKQHLLSLSVALFSGIIATYLLFSATNMVKDKPDQLAAVEAAQSGSVVFSILAGVFILGDPMPDTLAFIGIALIIIGIVANSFAASRDKLLE